MTFGRSVAFTNNTDRRGVTELLLKVALNVYDPIQQYAMAIFNFYEQQHKQDNICQIVHLLMNHALISRIPPIVLNYIRLVYTVY
jgi:hypothetical protein